MTTRRELSPRYDAAAVEPAIYERWMAADAFRPAEDAPPGAQPFVVIQPPPNVTGALHIGHALTATVEDVMVRYHRMRGDDTLWLPGVDHASIAAQFVLDRILAEEGESRASLGREGYLERMWGFIDETRGVIGNQHRRLGASVDWSRERFTMDEMSARAVRETVSRRTGCTGGGRLHHANHGRSLRGPSKSLLLCALYVAGGWPNPPIHACRYRTGWARGP